MGIPRYWCVLTQDNISVGQRCIYYFRFLIVKPICIMFLTYICIIKGILVVFGFTLAWHCWKRFSGQLVIFFKRNLSTDWISTHDITYYFLIDIVMFYNRFSTSRHFKLVGYACYLVHSLSTWFTHSLIFPSSQVKYRSCFPVTWWLSRSSPT